jgi:hypothetical protein
MSLLNGWNLYAAKVFVILRKNILIHLLNRTAIILRLIQSFFNNSTLKSKSCDPLKSNKGTFF